jgi:hypothetical protein
VFVGLGKKIDALAKKKECGDVALWKRSIINHLYYVAAEAPQANREEVAEAMWVSICNHIQDIHEHDNELFVMCEHPHLRDEERNKQWLLPGTASCELLTEILTATALVKDVRRLSPKHQTSELEAFHSLVIQFAPKSSSFMWLAQLAR